MLNFHQLQPIVDEKYSFVGIQKQDNKLLLYLPKGFDINNYDTYYSKRNIYLLLYKILHRYKQICAEKGILKNQLKNDRDGVIQTNGSVQKVVLHESDDDEVLLYSKLDVIAKILDAYDEPKIMSLAYRLGESEEIDYSQIHQYLDRAKYLPNGAAYIDTMDMPRLQVKYQSTDIVGMYCYIFIEVKQQLGEEIISEIKALSEEFAHRYLDTESGFFNEESCIQTVEILKDILETIEHRTPIKDADYWDFHNAVKLFLYGELSQQEEGEIWGINNFCYVWESMCLTYLAKSIDSSCLWYIDSNYLSLDIITRIENEPKLLNVNNAFKNLRPDVVVLDNLSYDIQQEENIKKEREREINFYLRTYYENSYHDKITFDCNQTYFKKKRLRIGYANQLKNNHTFKKLQIQRQCIIPTNQHRNLIINSRLPNIFYSFWRIDTEALNQKTLFFMYIFNHIFYVAIENGVDTKDKFDEFFNNLEGDVFQKYLLRDASNYNYSYGECFEDFVKVITCSKIKIIDIKYKPIDYYFNKNNIEEIKSRDIRKQFEYEQLLKGHIQNNPNFNQLEIKSSFWLPTDDDSQDMSKVEAEFLNGYIELNKVSFNTITKSYLE